MTLKQRPQLTPTRVIAVTLVCLQAFTGGCAAVATVAATHAAAIAAVIELAPLEPN